jgi:hypothetical protein
MGEQKNYYASYKKTDIQLKRLRPRVEKDVKASDSGF